METLSETLNIWMRNNNHSLLLWKACLIFFIITLAYISSCKNVAELEEKEIRINLLNKYEVQIDSQTHLLRNFSEEFSTKIELIGCEHHQCKVILNVPAETSMSSVQTIKEGLISHKDEIAEIAYSYEGKSKL